MNKKRLLSCLSVCLLTGCQSSNEKLSIIELVPEADKVLENEKTRIDVKTDAANVKLTDSDFDAGKGEIEAEDGYVMFSAEETGTYTIKASKDGVESNPVTIEVVAQANPDDQQSSESKDQQVKDDSVNAAKQDSDDKTQNSSKQSSSAAQNKADSGDLSTEKDSDEQTVNPSASMDENTKSQSPIQTDLNSVMKDPESYLNQTIDLVLMVPQDLPDSKQAVLSDGTKLSVLLSEDGKNAIPVLNYNDFSNWGVKNEVIGVFKKQNAGDYNYVLKINDVIPQSLMSSANSFGGTYVGAPVSSMPSSGTFEFSADGVNIRNGDRGLEGEKTGLVYNAGMKVHYDKVYQKDGCTWISYIGNSKARRSVAVGNDQNLEYGFVCSD